MFPCHAGALPLRLHVGGRAHSSGPLLHPAKRMRPRTASTPLRSKGAGVLRGWETASRLIVVGGAAAACRSRRRPQRVARGAVGSIAGDRGTQTAAAAAVDEWFQHQAKKPAARRKFDAGLAESGLALLEQATTPARDQEPWRHTNLAALFQDEARCEGSELVGASPAAGVSDEAVLEVLEEHPEDAPRLVFVDGALRPTLSCFAGGGVGQLLVCEARGLRWGDAAAWARVLELLRPLPEVDLFATKQRDSLGCAKPAALNQASFEDCALVCFPAAEDWGTGRDDEGAAPARVHVVFVTTAAGAAAVSSPRLLVDLGAGRSVHLVETHVSVGDGDDAGLSNCVTRVLLGEASELRHEVLQQKADTARFVQSITGEVPADARYSLRVVQTGCCVSRVNACLGISGEGARCELTGVSAAARRRQQLDLHSLIHHTAPGGSSSQQQKNIAAASSECVFRGSIRVDRQAQQTESSQLCRSLLLSKTARAKVMPSMVIRADDVKCSHGAVVLQLDQKDAFYLSSRGLSESESRRLLLSGFPQDLLAGLADVAPKAARRFNDRIAVISEQVVL